MTTLVRIECVGLELWAINLRPKGGRKIITWVVCGSLNVVGGSIGSAESDKLLVYGDKSTKGRLPNQIVR